MVKRKDAKRNAPYVAAKALNSFFERIKFVSTPEKIDSGLLLDYGIPKGNVFALISAIKFLGLVDEEGIPTPAFKSLQVTGEEFITALKKIIYDAYSDLFSKLDISKDSRDHIRNYFARNYSNAKAGDSANIFLSLCRMAQIPISEELQPRHGTVAVKAPPRTRPAVRGTSSVIIQSELPQGALQDIISDDDLRKLYVKRLIEQIASPDTTGKDAEAIKAEAELRKAELNRIERLLKIEGENKESTED